MMNDTSLSQWLTDLGVDRLGARALAAMPMVQVVWADGKVSQAEHDAVVRLADEHLRLDEDGAVLLEDWLVYPPSPAYRERAYTALVALAARGQMGINAGLLDTLPHLATQVAQSTGGFLGFFRVSQVERAAIQAITKKFIDLKKDVDNQKLQVAEARKRMTVLLDDDDDDASSDPPSEELAVVGVLIHEHDGERAKYTCPEGGLVVGRDEACGMRLLAPTVAPTHARLIAHRRRYYIESLENSIGTFVNGERIRRRRVLGGERICVGSVDLIFKMARRA